MTKDKTATGTVKGVIRKYNDQSFEFTPLREGRARLRRATEVQEWRNHRQDTRCQRQARSENTIGGSGRRSSYVLPSIKLRLGVNQVTPRHRRCHTYALTP